MFAKVRILTETTKEIVLTLTKMYLSNTLLSLDDVHRKNYISSIDKPIWVILYFDNSLFNVATFSASSVGLNFLRWRLISAIVAVLSILY